MEGKNKILRTYDFSFSASDDEVGVITGRPIVYNSRTNIGYFDEVIEVGALNNTNLKDVRLCLNHDTSFVYARSRNNNANSTMQLSVDNEGMRIRAKLDIENSSKAKDLYSAIKRGDIDKMSFMFDVNGEQWEYLESEHPLRHITDISTVYEVSAVTFPAYEDTSISARDKETLDNAKEALERAKSTLDSEKAELELLKAKNRNRLLF